MSKELSVQIEKYQSMQNVLLADHNGKWVIFYDEELKGVFDTFEEAAEEAVRQYGRGPYLIRQVGTTSAPLPPSLLYGLFHADS